jgi:hypothetical protein
MINYFQEKIHLKDRDAVIKLHLLVKLYQSGFSLSQAEFNTLFELHKHGYTKAFFDACIQNKHFKTKQVILNAVIKMTRLGIIRYEKRGVRSIKSSFVPKITENKVMFQYLVGNLSDGRKG